jgi:hypothetical protein
MSILLSLYQPIPFTCPFALLSHFFLYLLRVKTVASSVLLFAVP